MQRGRPPEAVLPQRAGSYAEHPQDCNATAIEIAHIAGDHRERVNLGGGEDQHVGLCAALATRLQLTLGYETLNPAHVL